jgi:large subunit ribosomal protein L24
MKILRKDKVMVIAGRDKGKTGEVVAVLPRSNQVVVQGINKVKRHVKPNQKQPKGGIIEFSKPIDASKVMVIDPSSGRPARVGYRLTANGKKERIYKVSKFINSNAKKSIKKQTKDKVK